MEQLIQEREEIQLKLQEAQTAAEKSLANLQIRVQTREIELAALAAERIQQQADHSSEVIKNLQNQLEMVKNQLQSVETEKKKHLNNSDSEPICEGSSTQTFNEVGEVMESELQCSICAELFVKATTLNCSHTFCLYCISMWKKKKKDCPICRTSISTECKSLVLDTFIERMVQKLPEETKLKRKELLKSRQEEMSALTAPKRQTPKSSRRRRRRNTITTNPTMIIPEESGSNRPIPTIDLTMISTSSTMLPNSVTATATSPSRRLETIVMVSGGSALSQVVQGPTTVAMEDVTNAVAGDIGFPAARSSLRHPPAPNT